MRKATSPRPALEQPTYLCACDSVLQIITSFTSFKAKRTKGRKVMTCRPTEGSARGLRAAAGTAMVAQPVRSMGRRANQLRWRRTLLRHFWQTRRDATRGTPNQRGLDAAKISDQLPL